MSERRTVVWVSAGAASAVAAKIVLTKLRHAPGYHEVVLAYTDPGSEHLDNLRFLYDLESPKSSVPSSARLRRTPMVDTASQPEYYSVQSAASAPSSVLSGSGASGPMCGICFENEAVRGGRCWACYHSSRRNGGDENPQDRDARRARRKATTVPRREEPDEDTITYGDWCRSNGYDPTSHRYSQ